MFSRILQILLEGFNACKTFVISKILASNMLYILSDTNFVMEHLSEDCLYGLISQACDYVLNDITSTTKNKLDWWWLFRNKNTASV